MKKILYFIILLLLFPHLESYSQKEIKLSNPLFPSVNELSKESIGGFIGFGQNYQEGIHYSPCPDCEFMDGVRFGLTFGGLYEREISEGLFAGAILSFDILDISSSFLEREAIRVVLPDNRETFANVLFRHEAISSFNLLGLAPYIKYHPAGWLGLRLAPKVSYLVNHNLEHSQEPAERIVVIDGIENRITQKKQDIYNGDFPEVNNLLFGTDLSVLFNINTGKKSFLSLGYTHYFQFNNISNFGENFRVNSWRIFMEFRINIHKEFESKRGERL